MKRWKTLVAPAVVIASLGAASFAEAHGRYRVYHYRPYYNFGFYYGPIWRGYYAPYPGSALGYQLIAEGKSLMSKENYHRYPDDEKVKGIDYQFYRDLLAGRYDHEVNQGLPELIRSRRAVYSDALIKA